MDRITELRVKQAEGVYSEPVPIGAKAENVLLKDGRTVQMAFSDINRYDEVILDNRSKIANLFFDNVNTMANELSLKAGEICQTLGYYNAKDDGEATYLIRAKRIGETGDGGKTILLNNGNIAEMLIGDYVKPEQFGAKGDGAANDTTAIQQAINAGKLILFKKNYLINDVINVGSNKKLEFFGTVARNSKNIPTGYFFNFSSVKNIRIVGGRFISQRNKESATNNASPRINTLTSNIALFNAYNTDYLSFDSIETQNLDCSNFKESSFLRIRNCKFTDNTFGFYLDNSQDIVIENTSMKLADGLGKGDHCLSFNENTKEIKLQNCTFLSDNNAGSLIDFNTGGRTPNSSTVLQPKNIFITNCHFYGAIAISDCASEIILDSCAVECQKLTEISRSGKTFYQNCRIVISDRLIVPYLENVDTDKEIQFINCRITFDENILNTNGFNPNLIFKCCQINCGNFFYSNVPNASFLIKDSNIACEGYLFSLRKNNAVTIENSTIDCNDLIVNEDDLTLNVTAKFSHLRNIGKIITGTKSIVTLSCYNRNNILI